MSDFDRLFEQSNELRGKSDGDTSGFRGWTLILVLAISAIGTMVTFSVRAPSSLHIETKSDFLTVAMEQTGIAYAHSKTLPERPVHWVFNL